MSKARVVEVLNILRTQNRGRPQTNWRRYEFSDADRDRIAEAVTKKADCVMVELLEQELQPFVVEGPRP